MAITQPRKVQTPKFWCLKSSTNIWLSSGNINSIPKVKNIELEWKEGSKLAKIGQFFTLKKLKLHFLKNFPRFDFTAFFCDFQCIRPKITDWPSSWNRTGVVGGMHRWCVLALFEQSTPSCLKVRGGWWGGAHVILVSAQFGLWTRAWQFQSPKSQSQDQKVTRATQHHHQP